MLVQSEIPDLSETSAAELRALVQIAAREELATLLAHENDAWAPLLGKPYSKSRLLLDHRKL
jgi:hypothetical protein